MKGKIERPVLGVQVVAMSEISLRQRYYNNIQSESLDGVYIYSVQKGSAAYDAGLEKGDIIIFSLRNNFLMQRKNFSNQRNILPNLRVYRLL